MEIPFVVCLVLIYCIDKLAEANDCKISLYSADCRYLNLTEIPKDLPKNITKLNLNRNSIIEIQSLTFSKLGKLRELKLRFNSISVLKDGAFFGLDDLRVLRLDNNNITQVSKKWLLHSLLALHIFYLEHNKISSIEEEAWQSCSKLMHLDLSYNQLREISHVTFRHLRKLKTLNLDNNMITSIMESTFNTTPSLKHLYLNNNGITWIADGGLLGLPHLSKLSLAGNKITSISRNSFLDLNNLTELNLDGNNIETIEDKAFSSMSLKILNMNTSSLLCDCGLAWFPVWLNKMSIKQPYVYCAYPEELKGKNLILVPPQKFLCSINNNSKPVIKDGPKSVDAVSGSQVEFKCSAFSLSDPGIKFKWRRNNVDIAPVLSKIINNTSVLTISHVTLDHGGRYQCIVSNKFGTTYSYKANLTVTVLPMMTKKPGNITVKCGSIAKLECAAIGEPVPQVSWQKDGGTEFPAAHERRMRPTKDGFIILDTKPADSGLYSCIACNSAGTVTANATLNVFEPPTFKKKMENKISEIGGSVVFECMSSGWPELKRQWLKDGIPLTSSYQHFFTADNQLLVLVDAKISNSGIYQCEITNHIGTEKDTSHLTVVSGGSLRNLETKSDDITGVIIITVVCCAVGTSAVWVIIIYQTQKHVRKDKRTKHIVSNGFHLDNKSEHSPSSKGRSAGESTKRSGCAHNYEGELTRTGIEVQVPLLNTLGCSQEDGVLELNNHNSHSTLGNEIARSNHDRCQEL